MRLPTDISFSFSWFTFITGVFFIFLHVYLVYKIFFPPSDESRLAKLSIKINNFLDIGYQTLYEFLAEFELCKKHFFTCANWLLKLYNYTDYLYFFCYMLPIIIVAFAFFSDVVIFNYFYYFYKSLPLLLLPLISKGIISIFKRGAITLRKEINEFVEFYDISTKETETGYHEFAKVRWQPGKEPLGETEDINSFVSLIMSVQVY